MAHLIIFEHKDFRGAHRHLFKSERDLKASDDNFFNDKISSFVILEGHWQFHEQKNGEPTNFPVLGQGYYPSVQQIGITNDSVSSITLISET